MPLHLPFCLSFRSAAEESAVCSCCRCLLRSSRPERSGVKESVFAVAVAVVLAWALASLFAFAPAFWFVIPQRSGGICCCCCGCSFPLHLPFCLLFRSEAKESAVAFAVILAVALAFLFVIPQRRGGICCCSCGCSCRRTRLFGLSFRSAAEESAVCSCCRCLLLSSRPERSEVEGSAAWASNQATRRNNVAN